MINLKSKYKINNGQGSIVFKEGRQGTINATYEMSGNEDTGVINGTISGNVLMGTYHNKINNSTGLIEFTFSENGFDAKWKQGLEPGPMRGKWRGDLIIYSNKTDEAQNMATSNENIVNNVKTEESSLDTEIELFNITAKTGKSLSNHQVTAIIHTNLIDPDSDGDQISKDRLINYLKAVKYIFETLSGPPHQCDFFVLHKNSYFDNRETLELFETMIKFFDDQNENLEREEHKEFFTDNNNTAWPDVENGKIDFEQSFHYETWDTCKILVGFNKSEGDDSAATLAREIKEILLLFGEGNTGNWIIEIGDNLKTSYSYFQLDDTEDEE